VQPESTSWGSEWAWGEWEEETPIMAATAKGEVAWS
jgi:hypothetical protein